MNFKSNYKLIEIAIKLQWKSDWTNEREIEIERGRERQKYQSIEWNQDRIAK